MDGSGEGRAVFFDEVGLIMNADRLAEPRPRDPGRHYRNRIAELLDRIASDRAIELANNGRVPRYR